MVRLQTLDLRIGVQVPASQPAICESARPCQAVFLVLLLLSFGRRPAYEHITILHWGAFSRPAGRGGVAFASGRNNPLGCSRHSPW